MALAEWDLLWLMAEPQPEPLPNLADLIPPRPGWMAQAACRGRPEVSWFPLKGDTGAAAKAVCAGCPVRAECLAYALAEDLAGVWAGTSERERRAMRVRSTPRDR
jgi:WhiB family transcriptional regulator, redox-sensing transcriptional regulator